MLIATTRPTYSEVRPAILRMSLSVSLSLSLSVWIDDGVVFSVFVCTYCRIQWGSPLCCLFVFYIFFRTSSSLCFYSSVCRTFPWSCFCRRCPRRDDAMRCLKWGILPFWFSVFLFIFCCTKKKKKRKTEGKKKKICLKTIWASRFEMVLICGRLNRSLVCFSLCLGTVPSITTEEAVWDFN